MTEPLEGVVPWLPAPSLEVSVERSVRKLAFDRRRRSLKLRKDGAMAGRDCELSSSSKVACERRFVGSKRTSSKARLLSVPVEEDEEIKQTTRFGGWIGDGRAITVLSRGVVDRWCAKWYALARTGGCGCGVRLGVCLESERQDEEGACQG